MTALRNVFFDLLESSRTLTFLLLTGKLWWNVKLSDRLSIYRHLRGGKIGYALQAINITCFDSPCVEHMKKNIMALDDIFHREFVRDRYKRWTPKLFHGNIEISASSRYLTPAKLCPKSRSYTLNVDVDPTDVLNDAIMSGDWKHIDDNRVDYFRWEVDKNKKKTCALKS